LFSIRVADLSGCSGLFYLALREARPLKLTPFSIGQKIAVAQKPRRTDFTLNMGRCRQALELRIEGQTALCVQLIPLSAQTRTKTKTLYNRKTKTKTPKTTTSGRK
jgi:hypothetical protein